LVAETEAYLCERTVENDVFLRPAVEAAIQCTEKEIRSIAEADFRVGALQRQSGEDSHIGCNDGAGTAEGAWHDVVFRGRRRQGERAAVEVAAGTAVSAVRP